MKYNIWSEGYSATGEKGGEFYHGSVEANSLREACHLLFSKGLKHSYFYNPERLTYWGCRLYHKNELVAPIGRAIAS
jgi:hypothetical protein